MLVLSAHDVEELLPPAECAGVMREVLAALARGQVHQPLRTVLRPPDAQGLMALMPAFRSGEGAAYGLKAICIFPDNPRRGLDAHQGVVLLSSAETGEPLALLNASAITEIRTAGVSAVATDLLARAESRELAIIGAGVQARAHLAAIAEVRPLARVRVAGRDRERLDRFVAESRDRTEAEVTACATAEEAVRGADIVVTATNAAEPVLRRDWLKPGAHVNAVGACLPTVREIDAATMAAATLFVDRRESALAEAGDLLLAGLGADAIRAELGEVLIGAAPGRTGEGELTLFESLGLAAEDLAVAVFLHGKAARLGAGTDVAF